MKRVDEATKFRHYQRFNATFFGDPFLADLSDDLRPIHLGAVR